MPRIEFPWHTLLVNLLGAFLLGFLFLREGGMEHGPRLLLAVGFMGGLTTMSTYSVETIELWRAGTVGLAFVNIAANGLGGPALAWLGWKLAG